jgi:hypothetical protein
MDDLFDELEDALDPSTPFGMAIATGVLDDEDEERCGCFCGCRRKAEWPANDCEPCQEGRHEPDP